MPVELPQEIIYLKKKKAPIVHITTIKQKFILRKEIINIFYFNNYYLYFLFLNYYD